MANITPCLRIHTFDANETRYAPIDLKHEMSGLGMRNFLDGFFHAPRTILEGANREGTPAFWDSRELLAGLLSKDMAHDVVPESLRVVEVTRELFSDQYKIHCTETYDITNPKPHRYVYPYVLTLKMGFSK